MIKIKQTIIVEGKYDKIKLASIVDANIITTDGFRIYNNTEKRALIKMLAEKTGIVILTDSDNAGRKIRNFLKGNVDNKNIINVYIPKIMGKESRKSEPSKENLLGVEGIDADILREVFRRFGIIESDTSQKNSRRITKLDFYEDKLSGLENSSSNRENFCEKLGLTYMSANSLLDAVNILLTYEEYKKIVSELNLI